MTLAGDSRYPVLPLIHRQIGDISAAQGDLSLIRLAQADHHIEDCRLPRAVRPQQPDDLAGLHIEGHPFDNLSSAEALY